jgi:t-SNARE complex subunit (syntaxin)
VQVLVQHESDMKERIARHLDEVADEQEVESEYRYDANMNTDTFFKRYVFKEDAQRARDHLKEKHRDIAKIEKDLVELNGIMQDIGQLVEYHNELLDQIEMNVEEGKAKVNLGTNTNPSSSYMWCVCVADADDLLLWCAATQELAETRVIVQQIRRKKLMTFLTIGLIVVIVIVVIVVVAVIIL